MSGWLGAPDQSGHPVAPLYLQRHRIRSGKQTLRITVPSAPARAGIDPWRKLIEPERADNVVPVKTVGSG